MTEVLPIRFVAMPEVADVPELLAQLAALPKQAIEPAFEVVERLLGRLNALPKFLRVEPDVGTTTGTHQQMFVLAGDLVQPLRELVAALRAGNFNRFVFEHRWFSEIGTSTSGTLSQSSDASRVSPRIQAENFNYRENL